MQRRPESTAAHKRVNKGVYDVVLTIDLSKDSTASLPRVGGIHICWVKHLIVLIFFFFKDRVSHIAHGLCPTAVFIASGDFWTGVGGFLSRGLELFTGPVQKWSVEVYLYISE